MINPSKTELRNYFKNIRNSICSYNRHEKSILINDYALKYLSRLNDRNNIFVYQSFSSEVETGELINNLYKSGINILIPHCDTKTETMTAAVYNSEEKQTANIYGISEFTVPVFFDGKIDVIIVPGIAFDKYGNRIGFGKGYYDKFINSLSYKPVLIGLAYSEQVYDGEISSEETDVKLNIVITENGIMNIG